METRVRRQLIAAGVAAVFGWPLRLTGLGWFLSAAILACAVLAHPGAGK